MVKGLIIKDILNLKKNLKTTLLMIIVFGAIAYNSGDPSYIIGMTVMLLTTMSITSMSYDELAKWNSYALAMPVSRRNVVLSKYILSIILSISSILTSTVVAYILILPKSSMIGMELLLTSYIIFSISILFICTIFPLIYKFGVEKTRLLIIGVIAIPTAIFFAINEMGINMPNERQLMMLLKISPLILLVFLIISSSISYKIFRNVDI